MANRDGRDRYNYEHRSDGDFQIGESMPGTVGDSEGTLHDRLGELPTVDERLVSEPGAKARNREREREEAATQAAREPAIQAAALDGETTTLELTESTQDGAVGEYRGHRVAVKGGQQGETALVTLRHNAGTVTGERMRLRE